MVSNIINARNPELPDKVQIQTRDAIVINSPLSSFYFPYIPPTLSNKIVTKITSILP